MLKPNEIINQIELIDILNDLNKEVNDYIDVLPFNKNKNKDMSDILKINWDKYLKSNKHNYNFLYNIFQYQNNTSYLFCGIFNYKDFQNKGILLYRLNPKNFDPYFSKIYTEPLSLFLYNLNKNIWKQIC